MSQPFNQHPFLLSPAQVAVALDTSIDHGLDAAQVARKQQENPPNELLVQGSIAWHTILIRQLCNAMIIVSLVFLCSRTRTIPSEPSVMLTLAFIRFSSLLRLSALPFQIGLKGAFCRSSSASMFLLALSRNIGLKRKWTRFEPFPRPLQRCFEMVK